MPGFSLGKGELGDRSYFISNDIAFFHRFCDSGFRNKWTGFWSGEKKFLEYFAVRAGDSWLSPGTCESVEYNGSSCVHHYRIGENLISETVFMPDGSPSMVIQLESCKAVDFELELAVNIRKRHENAKFREYAVSSSGKSVEISNDLGRLYVRIYSDDFGMIQCPEYRRHFPSGEMQTHFVPGKMSISGKRVVIVISAGAKARVSDKNCGRLLKEKNRHYAKIAENGLKTDSEYLKGGFGWSVVGMELLKRKIDGSVCFYAGLPWFQQFWGRDVLWSLPAATELGYFDIVRKSLSLFSEFSRDGRIPNFVSSEEGQAYNSIDATLLWIIALEHYVRYSGDTGFLSGMLERLKESINFLLLSDRNLDFYIEHDLESNETWMDTINRKSNAVEIEALYCRSLLSSVYLLRVLKKHGTHVSGLLLKKLRKREEYISNDFHRRFFSGDFYCDRIDGDERVTLRTANPLVHLFYGTGKNAGKILDAIESDVFTTPKGVRTLASDQPGYDPSGYHTGGVWSLTTAWASAAEFSAGRKEKGWEYLRKMLDDMPSDSLGCIGECWDSWGRLTGCSLQLWGTAFVVRIIDEYMLGIRPDCLNGRIYVRPMIPDGIDYVEREIPFGTKKTRLIFRRNGRYFSVTCTDSKIKIIQYKQGTVNNNMVIF
ncbi:MAG: hypothetical protein JW754_06100 [Candidatus Aenigmarchaeota archaeon]|nr:hypothetical protein [Candidatus Aenigmarchaeota archaeon]